MGQGISEFLYSSQILKRLKLKSKCSLAVHILLASRRSCANQVQACVPRKQVLETDPNFLNLAQNFATDPCKGLAAARVDLINGLLSLRKTQNRAIAAVKV